MVGCRTWRQRPGSKWLRPERKRCCSENREIRKILFSSELQGCTGEADAFDGRLLWIVAAGKHG